MDNLYHDRKMLKWLPFDALPEQHGYLKAVYEAFEKITKPELLPDQIEYLNYRMNEAFHTQETIQITYFKDGKLYHKKGHILGFNPNDKSLVLNETTLFMEDILEIE
jgi:hypothetical protein